MSWQEEICFRGEQFDRSRWRQHTHLHGSACLCSYVIEHPQCYISTSRFDSTTYNSSYTNTRSPLQYTHSMATSFSSSSGSMPGPEESVPSTANNAPLVVGIYGIPGSGKTFLLHQLEQELGREHFEFYEGSRMIATLVPGGLDRFRQMTEQDKLIWRQCAIDTIRQECLGSGKVGVVTGHFMFWPEEEDTGQPVYTPLDLDTYTHILYLDVAAELIAQRRQSDTERTRPSASVNHLRKWQDAEKTQLRRLCRNHGILFCLLSVQQTLVEKVSIFLRDFRYHTEMYNLSCAEKKLDEVLGADQKLQTMLVLDADRTLAPEDTGELFWATSLPGKHDTNLLKSLFSGPLGYSYTAFRQAVLLYEETAADEDEFNALCAVVASTVQVHPEFLSLLRLVAEQDHVGAVVVTCGLRAVWEKVLEAEGLSKKVKVIGGGRIADGLVVTAAVKASVVSRLRDIHHLYVVAFGDSPLDLPMLSAADQAIVVVGEETTRSKTMDAALQRAMDRDGLRPTQALLPSHASPRLDVADLPIIQIHDPKFTNSILSRRHGPPTSPLVLHATGRNVAKLLMTPMRDANVNGPNLREAHRRVGWFLAAEFLTELVGLEEYVIPHVQGHQTNGFRLRGEQLTSIVALMRGGEPMAFGVSDALPEAMFIHAKGPKDVLVQHLDGRHTVILVDSVVNSGKTVVQFVRHIRAICSRIRIVVIAGVVQAQSVTDADFAHTLAHDSSLHLIALRLSDNKFTGKGTTDTGNRLFNPTCLC
ncbi:uracil phosphoribosyltransferase-domain-containing protein [Xylaria sp. FL1042]|nr:uracil phosphoribosyltransferase-domain-containing protein [Xylaria sp. FL1042]